MSDQGWGNDSHGSYYPPNQSANAYYHSSSSRHPRPSNYAPGGASDRPRTPTSNEAYYLPNPTSNSYYTSSSRYPRASPAPAGMSGRSFAQEGHSSGRHTTPSSYREVLHTWTQQGQITASEDLNSDIITVMLQDGRHAYQCGKPECKREGTFTSRSTVVAHIRTVHLQERPFICTTCNTTFGRKQDAERHVQSKNRGKVYQCQFCLETFSRKDYLSGVHEICCSARPGLHA